MLYALAAASVATSKHGIPQSSISQIIHLPTFPFLISVYSSPSPTPSASPSRPRRTASANCLISAADARARAGDRVLPLCPLHISARVARSTGRSGAH